MKSQNNFATHLERWYEAHGRDLPWRRTRDPWLIMLSEFILQQTQVSQGMGYYLRFAERFPTPHHLAEATEEEVLRLWQGLGYYSRARHLHAAAKQIARAGSFPQDYEAVRALPGIGPYTAAAIVSLAFGQARAVLDGNVQRVLARHFGIDQPVDKGEGRRIIRALADEMLDPQRPALYNQAIMDFGALQCKPSAPLCAECPLAESCQALCLHIVDRLPVKAARPIVRDRYLTYIYTRSCEGQVLLHRRPAGDIWQGLFEFPLIETEVQLPEEEVLQRAQTKWSMVNDKWSMVVVARDVRHQLTHQRLHADFYCLTVPQAFRADGGIWVKESDLDRYAIPRLLEKLLEKLAAFENKRNEDGKQGKSE